MRVIALSHAKMETYGYDISEKNLITRMRGFIENYGKISSEIRACGESLVN